MTSELLDAFPFSDHEKSWGLIEYARLAPSRVWLERYFDLMKVVIETLGAQNDDPWLVTSTPKSAWYFPISINNRYVLVAKRSRQNVTIGIIYGPHFPMESKVRTAVTYIGRFNPLYGENIVETPHFILFKDARSILEEPFIKEGWLEAARFEIKRATRSVYRRHHQPLLYRAVVDPEYRAFILNEAFSNT